MHTLASIVSQISDFPSNYCFAKQEKTRLLQPQTNDDARRSDGEVYPSNSVGQKSPWCLPRVAPVMGCRFSGDGQSFVFCGMPEAAGAPLSPRPEATPERTNHQRTQMFLSSHGNADAHLIHHRLQSEPASRIQEEGARWSKLIVSGQQTSQERGPDPIPPPHKQGDRDRSSPSTVSCRQRGEKFARHQHRDTPECYGNLRKARSRPDRDQPSARGTGDQGDRF